MSNGRKASEAGLYRRKCTTSQTPNVGFLTNGPKGYHTIPYHTIPYHTPFTVCSTLWPFTATTANRGSTHYLPNEISWDPTLLRSYISWRIVVFVYRFSTKCFQKKSQRRKRKTFSLSGFCFSGSNTLEKVLLATKDRETLHGLRDLAHKLECVWKCSWSSNKAPRERPFSSLSGRVFEIWRAENHSKKKV